MAYPNGSLLDGNVKRRRPEEKPPNQQSPKVGVSLIIQSSPHRERRSSGGVSPPYPIKNTYE
jgi:hypothetical protein